MTCTRCGSGSSCKNGRMNGEQRYRCRLCGYNYTCGTGTGYSVEHRQLALRLYLEGMGLRAIGRVLDVSNVTVLRWMRAYGRRAEQQAAEAPGRTCASARWTSCTAMPSLKKRLLGLASRRP
ncbi:helix-turn-helix domain-containing protein [Hymenobacter latericus]|uniref:helix-turn-helix domain-containing protein n=1 Tax=Hymenobacter sp. YIM 151858-1 TaxID=2987688 RepID=UPI0039B6633E